MDLAAPHGHCYGLDTDCLADRIVFELLFDARHRVLMTRLWGTYTETDVVVRDRAVARFVTQHGLVRGIMDFTEVETIDMPMELIVARAQGKPLLPGQMRVIVAPDNHVYGLTRIIAAHQAYVRNVEPLLVRTLEDAYRAMEIEEPDFRSLRDDLTRREQVMHEILGRIETAQRCGAEAEREQLRRKMLRMLDSAMAKPAAGKSPAITVGEVLSAALRESRVSDDDLAMQCPSCGSKAALSGHRILPGRDTTYACRSCGEILVVLSPADPQAAPAGYPLGGFTLRSSADIECPGGVLPGTGA